MPNPQAIKLAVVDDHKLFRKGLISLIELVNKDYTILFEADDGLDLQEKINNQLLPDIILMDVIMPRMDGFATVEWLKENHPSIKILVVSMIEKEETIVKTLGRHDRRCRINHYHPKTGQGNGHQHDHQVVFFQLFQYQFHSDPKRKIGN